MNEPWILEDRGQVSVLTLNRDSKRNALSRDARAKLEELVGSCSACRETMAVIITGQGERAFCAGADLEERAGMSEAEIMAWLIDLRRTFRAIETSPKVFLAAVNGAALGGGLELALACDLRVAAGNATLGLPETRLAIIPGGGGTQRLPRLIGEGRAKELIFTGRVLDAEEALAVGLVERLAPSGKGAAGALEEALSLASEIAACGPLAIAQAKIAIGRGLDEGLERGLEIETGCYDAVLKSRDRVEGLAAFAQKRRPVYIGE